MGFFLFSVTNKIVWAYELASIDRLRFMIDKSDIELVPRISDVSSTLRIRMPTYYYVYIFKLISKGGFKFKANLILSIIYIYVYKYSLLLSIILYFINYKR